MLPATLAAEYNLYVLLGSMGTSREAVCDFLVREYSMTRICAKEMVEAAKADPGAEYHHLVFAKEAAGEALPAEVVCRMILNHIRGSTSKTFVLDDYPIHPFHLYAVTDILARHGKIQQVIYLKCPVDVCVTRYLVGDSAASASTNHPEVKAKIEAYLNDLKPVIEFYHDKGLLVELDSAKPVEDTFKDVHTAIEAIKARGDF